MTNEDLKTMQGWSLERKIQVTQTRIIEWYEHYEGKVYVSFSGGKDSTVLLDLARRIYPDIKAVFVDTGLEYPEIRDFVKTKENVIWLKPKLRFDEVIVQYGWNFPSKDVAQAVYYAKKGSIWAVNKFRGLNKNGVPDKYKERYIKYAYLLDAPFLVSSNCCLIMKEAPCRDYERVSGEKPIVGLIASESKRRKDAWLKTGCNGFDSAVPMSKPMSFWTEADPLEYLRTYNIPYSTIYGDIIETNGKLSCTGEERTGCMFCPVGCHMQKEPNKYQRMKITHPKQYDYCMRPVEENGLGLSKVLDYIGVKYE